MGPTPFDGGAPEPGPPIEVTRGREYVLVPTIVFGAAAVAAILLPFATLGTTLVVDASPEVVAAALVPGSTPLVLVIRAGNRRYFGSSGEEREQAAGG